VAISADQTLFPEKTERDFIGFVIVVFSLANLCALGVTLYFLQKLSVKLSEIDLRTQKLAIPEVGQESPLHGLGILFPLEVFLVNVPSEQGRRFLQVEMELELTQPSVQEEMNRKKSAVRDAILMHLSSRSYREIINPSAVEKLRQDLVRLVNSLLASGKVKNIYFTQYHFN